jgi:hypothetical protein
MGIDAILSQYTMKVHLVGPSKNIIIKLEGIKQTLSSDKFNFPLAK